MPANSRVLPLVIAAAWFMENMDSTVIATSLPTMARDLGTDPVALKLAFTTYLLSLTVFIPISGWLADKHGARNVFQIAIGIFLAGSIACGQSQSLEWLIASRALQGVGGALMVPVGRVLLLREIPKSQIVEVMAWVTIPALVGPLVGPPIGGFITTYGDWRWIFWMNVPIGFAGIALGSRYIPAGNAMVPPPLDVRGFLLSAIGLTSAAFGATIIGRGILSDAQVAGMIIAGMLLLALYVRHASKAEHPILDLKLLRVLTFNAGVIGGSLYRVGVGAIPFLLPLLLQLGLGYSPWHAGLLTASGAVGSIAMKFTTTRLLRRFGFRLLLAVNSIISAVFIAAYGFITQDMPVALLLGILIIGGFLRSLQFTAMNALAYSDIDGPAAASATSFYSVAQQLSLSAGVAVAAVVLELAQWMNGDLALRPRDFALAFAVVAAISAMSVVQFLRLDPKSGSAVLERGGGVRG
jgi:EmrB/QacA subfamily drug resistance transporter